MTLVAGQVAVDESTTVLLSRTIVLTVFSGVLGLGIGLLHRWYANEKVPDSLSVIVGLSGVAVYLNTAGALGDVIGGRQELLATEAVIFNVVTFLVAGVVAWMTGRAGDRIGIDLFAVAGGKSLERDVTRIVKTVGRVTTVEIPDGIDDMTGYDPVDPATKEKLAGQTLLFPRRLTVEDLRARFVERLKTDYGVGYVDVDFADDATVEYLALGSRESGLGPTLPPGSAAVAVRADPPNNASPGDAVQLWTGGDTAGGTAAKRVVTAELRGAVDDVATVTLDESDAKQLDTGTQYRLVTMPIEPRTDREFAAQLRAAEETMGVVTIVEGSALTMGAVGALDVAVVALRTVDGEIDAIPPRTRTLSAGETIYAIGRPDRLRKLEGAAGTALAGQSTRDE